MGVPGTVLNFMIFMLYFCLTHYKVVVIVYYEAAKKTCRKISALEVNIELKNLNLSEYTLKIFYCIENSYFATCITRKPLFSTVL